MEFEIVYPKIRRASRAMLWIRQVCAFVFLAAAAACVTVNLALGGRAWSVVVLWCLAMVWTLVLKTPLVERNLISQGVKLAVMVGILLVLIDRFLAPGWAAFVVPIVAYGALMVLAVLFFVNVSKQRHNVMPLVAVTLAAGIGAAVALFVFSETRWPMIVLAATAGVLLIVTVLILRTRLLSELVKRFHLR